MVVDDLGDERIQGINSHGINLVIPDYSVFSNRRVNSSPSGQNGCHLADHNFKCIFLNENNKVLIRNSPKFVPRSPIDNKPALFQVNRRRAIIWTNADSVYPTHICGTRWKWVNATWSKLCKCYHVMAVYLKYKSNFTAPVTDGESEIIHLCLMSCVYAFCFIVHADYIMFLQVGDLNKAIDLLERTLSLGMVSRIASNCNSKIILGYFPIYRLTSREQVLSKQAQTLHT